MRGTAQNPDVYFQGRETVNPYYPACEKIVQEEMDKFAKLTGRKYKLVDYVGAKDAERVVVVMGSGADVVQDTVENLAAKGEKVGVVKIRLYRPFPLDAFIKALPKTVKKIAVLDRTKEPGALGEPIYLDVRTAIGEAMSSGKFKCDGYPVIVGGRYGLGSKEFNPAMAKAVLDNLKAAKPKNKFVVGIEEDVTNCSLKVDYSYKNPMDGAYQAMFFGLGSDGTVGANKNSIKIIGEETSNNAQAYFVYDSKKAGSMTTSHLRFGKKYIRAPYLVQEADFVACHNFSFLEKYDMLAKAKPGATFLLNAPFAASEVWDTIPKEVQQQIIDKKMKFYVIDGVKLGNEIGLGPRINVIMQTAFFKISNIIPLKDAVASIKDAIKKSYGKAGEKVLEMNYKAVDAGLNNFYEVKVPAKASSKLKMAAAVSSKAPKFVKEVTGVIVAGLGDNLPVSKMPADGTFPTATSQYEKRNIATEIPVWDEAICIQCGICSFVCPHAAVRTKAFDSKLLKSAPKTFKSTDCKIPEMAGKKYTVQVAPEDCTGCGACAHNCPGKDKQNANHKALDMHFQPPLRAQEVENFDFFLALPDVDPTQVKLDTLRSNQLIRPLFEFSGACAGCGETPYLKLLTQLFGDRMLVANATGCSSIYGGNLPTTPYAQRADGRGPAWSNSLFEDNAEFGYGMRLTVDQFAKSALDNLNELISCDCKSCKPNVKLMKEIIAADQSNQAGIEAQRKRVDELKKVLKGCKEKAAKQLVPIVDYLVKKSVWCIGGDGWAYDIGFGGLDHVIASGKNINLFVLDTEVYSNTGGQASKSTPMGAVGLFAAGGKPVSKKDLGMIAMSYGSVYVAQVSLANPAQCIKAMLEAEAYDGPSIIIAYSHCIAHGIDMTAGVDAQKKAVQSGYWPLYRYNPALAAESKNPLQLDSKAATIEFSEYTNNENRYRMLKKANPKQADELMKKAGEWAKAHFAYYQKLAALNFEDK
jgi:pyruvate-ferredoxin/flavodoxin oxidoreductase